ncbi:hypothetical protein ES708_33635 [subsurface metagenome]
MLSDEHSIKEFNKKNSTKEEIKEIKYILTQMAELLIDEYLKTKKH